MSILIAIVGLALLIMLHEGGHFLVARLCGMKVERFSIGFGKPLLSFKKGDTIYQISPVPLGGFVQITGLNPHEEFDRSDPYVYPNRPKWMRLCVLVAGPMANYLTATVLAIGVFLAYGKTTNIPTVGEVMPGTPAAAAGLQVDDILVEAGGQPVVVGKSIKAILESKGAPVPITIKRGVDIKTLVITPRKDPVKGEFLIGIKIGQLREKVPVFSAIGEAIILPYVASGEMLKGIWDMIAGRQKANFSGPVGIAREMAHAADRGALDFLQLMMLLSIYLGLFNLLPLPALDGGRVLFLGINALRPTGVSEKAEATVHMVGLVFLLGMFVLVTFKDIREIIIRFVS